MRASFWQMLYTTASMIGALNSIILGITCTLALRGTAVLPLPAAATLGVTLTLVAYTGHIGYEHRAFTRGVT